MSLAEAKEKGIPVIAYGQFINDVVSFLIVAFAVFLLVKQVNRLKSTFERPVAVAAAATRACPFCAMSIPLAAKRCPHCTSQL
jgi:large conductance mechanosensitive channel